ncbi:MAG: discoidin domain-containing protein, partial [Pseudomonadota bacterium]|nr:discoidin domain-containing protein [Pseudomonadota bacterium]
SKDATASILPRPHYPNIALGKSADQSSVSAWSLGKTTREDAAGAVNGRTTGSYQHHTAVDQDAWWRLDLGAPASVHEIRVFNCVDNQAMAARLSRFVVEISADGARWQVIATKLEGNPVGGIDGNPFRVVALRPFPCRFIRVRLPDPGCLHLDQVEVYGELEPACNGSVR